MSKVDDLLTEMRKDPLRNEGKPVIHLIKSGKETTQNKYTKLINEMKETNKSLDENRSESGLQIPEDELQRIRETVFRERMEKLKEEDPAEYYRIRAGIMNKTTSKKSKRKRKKIYT